MKIYKNIGSYFLFLNYLNELFCSTMVKLKVENNLKFTFLCIFFLLKKKFTVSVLRYPYRSNKNEVRCMNITKHLFNGDFFKKLQKLKIYFL